MSASLLSPTKDQLCKVERNVGEGTPPCTALERDGVWGIRVRFRVGVAEGAAEEVERARPGLKSACVHL